MPAENQESLPKVAPLTRRALAVVLDAIIQFTLFLAITQAVGDSDMERGATLVAVLVAGAVYNIGFLASFSGTPGKLAMRIWVSDGEGNRIRPDQAILRHLVVAAGNLSVVNLLLLVVFSLLSILSILMVLFDVRRRALHDRIAGTLVVSGRPPAPDNFLGRPR